jgi:hypothetical protein
MICAPHSVLGHRSCMSPRWSVPLVLIGGLSEIGVYVLVRLCAISCTPSDMGLRHQYFIARTVLVRNGNVDEAVRLLNR